MNGWQVTAEDLSTAVARETKRDEKRSQGNNGAHGLWSLGSWEILLDDDFDCKAKGVDPGIWKP